jgi:hypothetical protein
MGGENSDSTIDRLSWIDSDSLVGFVTIGVRRGF